MDIQVFKVHNLNQPKFYGAACKRADCPEMTFIFVNIDQPEAEQRRTLRHEVWHTIQMEHGTDQTDQAEAEARAHENDAALDEIIENLCLWQNAIAIDTLQAPEKAFISIGHKTPMAAAGSPKTSL